MKKKLFVLLTIMMCISLITGCGKKKKVTNDNTNIEKVEREKISVQVKDNQLYINNKLVDLYKEYDNDKINEEDFYNLENITYKYEIMDDIVYLEVESDIYKEAFFVDKNGIVLKKISDMNLSLKKSDDLNYLVAYDILKAEGNSIYLKVKRFYESAACSDVLDNKGDAIYSTVDKITYVGENKFTIEKKVSDTITSGKYVESNGGINFCSENIGVK